MRAVSRNRAPIGVDARTVVIFGIALAALAYIAYELITASIPWSAFLEVSPASLLLVVLARVTGSLLFAVQWKALQDRLSVVSFRLACRVIVSTYYMNYLPFRGPQLIARALTARRHGVSYVTSLPSLAVNLLARWVIIGSVLLLLGYRLTGAEEPHAVWPISAAGVLVPAAFLLTAFLARRTARLIPRTGGQVAEAEVLLGELSRNLAKVLHWRSLLVYATALSAAVLLEYWAMAVLWNDLGAPVFFIDLMLAFLAGGMVGWFSQLPGGFGVHEIVSAYLVSLVGVDFGLALAIMLLSRVLVLLVDVAVSGGSFLLVRQIPHSPPDLTTTDS